MLVWLSFGVLFSLAAAGRLNDNSRDVQNALLTVLTHPGFQEGLHQALSLASDISPPIQPANETESLCETCATGVDLLYSFIYLGFEYEDLREIIIPLCEDALNDAGERGDVICRPALDLFGPEVTYILTEKDSEGVQVCLELNICDPDEIPPPFTGADVKVNPSASKQSSQNPLRIVHLTDAHLEESYIEGSAVDCGLPVCCRNDTDGEGAAGIWGEYMCNTPPRTVELYLNHIKALNPDFIIYTGDNPPHALWAETEEGQLSASQWVAAAMERILGEYRILPNIGNHETYPTNLYYLARNSTRELNRQFAAMWSSVARFSPSEISSIETGGYYHTLIQPGLRLVNYNSNHGYIANFYVLLDGNTAAMRNVFSWMETTLFEAREAGEKVILSGHHPAGRSDNVILYGQLLSEVCAEYSDVIVLHVIGHTHNDEFMLVTSSDDVVGVQMTAPAATGRNYVNPSVRVFTMDTESYQVLDFDQYHIDLSKAAASPADPELEFVYSAKEEYGLADLSSASFADLANRFESDEALFEKYIYNRGTRTRPASCDAECKKEMLCQIRNSSWDRNRVCLKN